jgi:hypothetical protein
MRAASKSHSGPNCGRTSVRSRTPDTNKPPSYPLELLSSQTFPRSLISLLRWLDERSGHAPWKGKIYVAKTIHCGGDGSHATFAQAGCSPNFQAGWWTLACCKHGMRSARPFKEQLEDGIPTFIFTLAEKGEAGQALVSVAKVTNTREDMTGYAKFVVSHGKRFASSRLTREHRDDDLLGWRFGDCHADSRGLEGLPDKDHVHGAEGSARPDRDRRHVILISNDYLLWPTPWFVAKKTLKQSCYGHNIDRESLPLFLTEARKR